MKLKNKKTGEIRELQEIMHEAFIQHNEKSLMNLNEDWEDYEEPKEHWCITMYGGITRIKDDEEPIDDLIEIGNYFNSKEDAYDAWDKLKAWKRLKDKGFDRVFSLELGDALCGRKTVAFKLLIDDKDSIEDIKRLFGVEE